ncbi:gp051R [Rabbit fibroma virus]|uniref:Protein OPG091 n=1 Tax=Rabbit fibroma virus (strain Kasza) TaxID=10272 RepID=Q9Q920_RFVKA|nr:gp051R [Rabbit fibroma virus]AAF17933.1 gp051R [Rabbit fibroma virus]
MDPITFISNYAPKGSVIFINYKFSLTEFFNPSEDKHAAIYIGQSTKTTYDLLHYTDERWIVEATYKNGVNKISVQELVQDATNIKVYILDDYNFETKMSIAADIATSFIGTPYGFGSNNLYCFKLVADCYKTLGVVLPTYNILGKRVYLSQSFTCSKQWRRIYDFTLPDLPRVL